MSDTFRPTLQILSASTRPGRIGLPVTRWFHDLAIKHDAFETVVVDLAELNLPMLDEPNHPRLRKYVHRHTWEWSEIVQSADALVFVTPEYNFGMPGSLKNALDFLHGEWAYKPAGFVSYGGVSAGTRSVQMAKQVVTTLKMWPVTEAVQIPFVSQFVDSSGEMSANEVMEQAATAMLDELAKAEVALRPMRRPVLSDS